MKAKIKVWIVRSSAISVQIGGLERIFVHFTKPEYVFVKYTEKDRDTPFGEITEKEGLYSRYGWIEPNRKLWVNHLSVGKWIGYENELSDFIWKKLKEHFHNEPIDNWHTLEKEGKSNIEDFLIEMEISISIN